MIDAAGFVVPTLGGRTSMDLELRSERVCLVPLARPRRRLASMRRLLVTIALAVGVFGVAGCTGKPTSWKEEVQLQSGEVIVVKRTIQFKEYQPIGGGGGSDTPVSALEIISPQRPDNPAPWSQPPLLPMVFDRDPDNHEWFVVATFYMCTAWYDLGRPKLPYAEFRYRGGQWIRVQLSEKLIGREANMLIPNQADVTRDHSLGSKRSLMGRPTMAPDYKFVVPTWKTNC